MSKISYYLLKNATGTQASYRPVVVPREGSFQDFVEAVAQKSGQSPTVVRAVLEAIGPALGERTAQGYSTDWPDFALFKPQLADATVLAPDAPLPTSTRADLSVLLRGTIRVALGAAETERVAPPATAPEWDSVNAENGQLNAVTDRTILKINGKNLDFDASRDDEGLFLRPQAGGEALKAVATRHTAQKIDVLAPAGLTSGTAYNLELHTRGAHGAASHELETYIWPGTLVAA